MVALKVIKQNETSKTQPDTMGQKNILIFMYLLATAHGHKYFNRYRLRLMSY